MSEENIENIKNINKSGNNFASTFVDHHLLPDIDFNAHCLIKNDISIPKKVINIYIYYTQGPQLKNLDFTLGNCLFGSVKLTKNADPEKWKYIYYNKDLILVKNFYLQMEAMEKMSWFLELTWAHMCMLIIREKIS